MANNLIVQRDLQKLTKFDIGTDVMCRESQNIVYLPQELTELIWEWRSNLRRDAAKQICKGRMRYIIGKALIHWLSHYMDRREISINAPMHKRPSVRFRPTGQAFNGPSSYQETETLPLDQAIESICNQSANLMLGQILTNVWLFEVATCWEEHDGSSGYKDVFFDISNVLQLAWMYHECSLQLVKRLQNLALKNPIVGVKYDIEADFMIDEFPRVVRAGILISDNFPIVRGPFSTHIENCGEWTERVVEENWNAVADSESDD